MENSESTKIDVLFSNSPTPIYLWQKREEDFVLIDYNSAAHKFTDGKISNLIGSKASQLYHDDLKTIDLFHQTLLTKNSIEHDLFYRLGASNRYTYLKAKFAFFPDDMVLVFIQDKPSIPNNEDLLDRLIRYTEDNYQTLPIIGYKSFFSFFDQISDGILALDVSLRVIYFNKSILNILGKSLDAVQNRYCYEIFEDKNINNNCANCSQCQLKIIQQGVPLRSFKMRLSNGNNNNLVKVSSFTINKENPYLQTTFYLLQKEVLPETSVNPYIPKTTLSKSGSGKNRLLNNGAMKLKLLTVREQEVLHLLANGMSTDRLSKQLDVSESTVRNHINNILQKLEVHSRLEAVALLKGTKDHS